MLWKYYICDYITYRGLCEPIVVRWDEGFAKDEEFVGGPAFIEAHADVSRWLQFSGQVSTIMTCTVVQQCKANPLTSAASDLIYVFYSNRGRVKTHSCN
jgi:hypothetical protein